MCGSVIDSIVYVWFCYRQYCVCVVLLQVSLDYSREEKVNHEEVLQTSKMRAEMLQKLVNSLIVHCNPQDQ